MPGKPFASSLAEPWSLSDDGLTYEFVLHKGTKFHIGEAVTSEGAKHSCERRRGLSNQPMKDHVAAVEKPDVERALHDGQVARARVR